jgi:predicted DCC family thiol-disulfide oxidoreductase YuxK
LTQETRESTSVVLFDGECNLCDRAVQFMLQRDRAKRLRFASRQSPAAQRLLQQIGCKREDLPESIALVEDGKVYTKSTAALRIAKRLGGLWQLASVFLIIPAPLRNVVYDWIARNRHKWFGKRDECMLPTAETRERFLDE